jgi:hypothetical protein
MVGMSGRPHKGELWGTKSTQRFVVRSRFSLGYFSSVPHSSRPPLLKFHDDQIQVRGKESA